MKLLSVGQMYDRMFDYSNEEYTKSFECIRSNNERYMGMKLRASCGNIINDASGTVGMNIMGLPKDSMWVEVTTPSAKTHDARDNDKLKSYEKEPCPHCDKFKTFEGHDGCLGTLDGVANTCCNHGGHGEGAYVQFLDGTTIHGNDANTILEVLKRNKGSKSNEDKMKFLEGCVKYLKEEWNIGKED